MNPDMVTFIIVAFLVFILLRAVVLWYWKIDKIVENLESLNKKVEGLDNQTLNEILEVLKRIEGTKISSEKSFSDTNME